MKLLIALQLAIRFRFLPLPLGSATGDTREQGFCSGKLAASQLGYVADGNASSNYSPSHYLTPNVTNTRRQAEINTGTTRKRSVLHWIGMLLN